MPTLQHLKKIKDKVAFCLENYPDSRNNDIDLTWYVRTTFYGIIFDYVSREQMHKLPTQETVKRIRAKFNEYGEFMPTDPKVWKQRKLNEEQYREIFGQNLL